MINESGTMSGGGGKPRGGRMCLGNAAPKTAVDAKQAAEELQAAEQVLNDSAEALSVAREQLAEAAGQAKQAERSLVELETAIPKARLEAKMARAKAADLRQRMGELQAATKLGAEDAARIKTLAADIACESKAVAELRSKSEGLKQQAAALEAQIEGAGGELLKRQRALVERLQQEIAACEKEATKKDVQAAAVQKALEKLRKEMDKGRAEQERLAVQQAEVMAEFRSLEDAAFRVLEVAKATHEQLGAKEGELAVIKSEYEQKQKEVGLGRTCCLWRQ